jgi:hypothetical protein
MIPNWFSYRGKGSSLSFHIPPVFQGLVVGVVCQRLIGLIGTAKLCIKNKSNGIQLFEATVSDGVGRNWLRYISLSEMAMKEYCEDEELELCVGLYTGEDAEVFECGIHVIVEKTDSFEGSEWDHESEVGRDGAVIPAPPYLSQYARYNFFEIYGKQGLSNLSKNTKDRLLEVLVLSLLHTNKHTIGTRAHRYIYYSVSKISAFLEFNIYAENLQLSFSRVFYSLQGFFRSLRLFYHSKMVQLRCRRMFIII